VRDKRIDEQGNDARGDHDGAQQPHGADLAVAAQVAVQGHDQHGAVDDLRLSQFAEH
jgi:hypothetical protein